MLPTEYCSSRYVPTRQTSAATVHESACLQASGAMGSPGSTKARKRARLRCERKSTSRWLQITALLALVWVMTGTRPAQAEYRPLVAIVMCPDTYAFDWSVAHSSSQGLVGLAGLIGVPYRTLTLDELLDEPVPQYSSVWFSTCSFVAEERIVPLDTYLEAHVDAGGSVFLEGPLGAYYEDADGVEQYRGMSLLSRTLGVVSSGWYGMAPYSVYTTDAAHPIATAAGHAANTQLIQPISTEFGMETMNLAGAGYLEGQVLLEMRAPGMESHPYLVATELISGARIVASGSYNTYVAAGSAFREMGSAGFYDNLLTPYIIESLLWMLGPKDEPFVGLQLSHAPMTVVGRLDGDWSNEENASLQTFLYLINMGKRTGVATVYGIVSEFAKTIEWNGMAQASQQLEALGGSVGTHSANHNNEMSDTLSEGDWEVEVANSLAAIRTALSGAAYAPEAYAFINPGDTVHMADYARFFGDIELFMTHGFETSVTYSTGVMGFGLPDGVEPKPVINNSPVPDYQWLYAGQYEPEWNYTLAQATEYQKQLLGYYQNRIGRGVLYNQMWHDYAIGANLPPPLYPNTGSLLPLYDANVEHFATERIYAPAIRELVGKMHSAHKVAITSSPAADGTLKVTLDYSGVPAEHRAHVAGMGLRVHASPEPIAEVTVDGAPHHAFTSDTVLVPPLGANANLQNLSIRLGEAEDTAMRVTYVSKAFADVAMNSDSLELTVAQPGLATRFCVAAPMAAVMLRASGFQRQESGELCGHLNYGVTTDSITVQPLDAGIYGLYVMAATRPITMATSSGSTTRLELEPGEAAELVIESAEMPAAVLLDGAPATVSSSDGALTIALPASTRAQVVDVDMPVRCPDQDSDGVTTCDMDCNDLDPAVGADCEPSVDGDGGGGCGCAAGGAGAASGLPGTLVLIGCVLLAVRRRRR